MYVTPGPVQFKRLVCILAGGVPVNCPAEHLSSTCNQYGPPPHGAGSELAVKVKPVAPTVNDGLIRAIP